MLWAFEYSFILACFFREAERKELANLVEQDKLAEVKGLAERNFKKGS